ncbi:MAG: exosome complex protein Rrp42 [Candidatus Aenigmarchaeota archaeon]|nr:exosome complex protein Rrp42 [Candidatus Aenigmarchaeota archaeon]
MTSDHMRTNYIFKLLEKGERIDGRKLDEFREIKVLPNAIERAEGSSRVIMGKTDVIVGIKLEIGVPFPDMPNMGTLKTGAEFSPIAHKDFEPGPPSEDATELARVVDRGIRESDCIELEKLCITEKEKAWDVYVDVHIINHDGNLIDASSLAAVSALLNARIPKLEDKTVIRTEFTGKLPVVKKPITVTIGKIMNNFLVDPTKDEEDIFDSRLSVATIEDGKICAMQKGNKTGLKESDVEEMIKLSTKKAKELRKLL